MKVNKIEPKKLAEKKKKNKYSEQDINKITCYNCDKKSCYPNSYHKMAKNQLQS